MSQTDLKTVAARALSMLDLTSLNDGDSEADIVALCDRAKSPLGRPAAVCVWPRFVALAKSELAGTGVKVAAVANFPDGAADIDRAVADTEEIVAAGGDEVDVVFPYRALMDGDAAIGAALVEAVKQACGDRAALKVIIESGALKTDVLIRQASDIALEAGADFIKTSTGKVPINATPEAAKTMLEAIKAQGRGAFKAAGGVRDAKTAGAYLAMADDNLGPDWATPETFRFGASGLLTDLHAVLSDRADAGGDAAASDY